MRRGEAAILELKSMQKARNYPLKRRPNPIRRAVGLLQPQMASIGVALWLLFLTAWIQPLHLSQEIRALLPESAQTPFFTDCQTRCEPDCEKLDDGISAPLCSAQRECHRQACCIADGHFFVSGADALSAAPQPWDVASLDFVPVARSLYPEISGSPKASRAPPQNVRTPLSFRPSLRSGRAPPVRI